MMGTAHQPDGGVPMKVWSSLATVALVFVSGLADAEPTKTKLKLVLRLPREITVVPGEKVKVPMRVERTNIKGAVAVKFTLPPWLKAEDAEPRFEKGEDKKEFVLVAGPEASVGEADFLVMASSGKVKTATAKVKIKVVPKK
jgi:hypothetical protein